MDVFSHGLWAGAVFKAINLKKRKPLSAWWAAFWGVFPDVFTFWLPFAWLIFGLLAGSISMGDLPPQGNMEPAREDGLVIFRITDSLYSMTHSISVFLVIFAAVWLIFRKPMWVLGGWLVHIIIDIPTHSYKFYPTPFLWPLSDWKFNGFSWGTPWFIITNYSFLLVVYLLLWKKKKLKRAK